MTMWSGYPNYGSKNRKGGNLKRKEKRKIKKIKKWKGNENNLEFSVFSLDNSMFIDNTYSLK